MPRKKQRRKRSRGEGSKILRGAIWWIKYSHKGIVTWESTRSRVEEEADKLLARRRAELAMGERPFTQARVTIADLVALVIEDYKLRKLRDLDITEYRADRHILPDYGAMKSDRFRSAQIKEYIEKRRAAGAADSTINRELAIFRRGFHLAAENDPPLVMRVPKIPKLEEDNARQGFLEADQYRALRDALPDRLKCLLVVGYHLGLRLGTLRRLQWKHVDLKGCTIRIPAAMLKQKKAQTLPIYGEMKPWLEMQHADYQANWPDCPWVFHNGNKRIGCHVKGWREASKAAGVPDILRHDLRRTAVRNMERAGVPRSIAMKITGHKTEAVYRRYDIVDERDLKQAGVKMEAYFGAKKGPNSSNVGSSESPEKSARRLTH